MDPRRLIRILLSLGILLVLAANNLGILDSKYIRRLENIAYDVRLNATLPRGIDDRIVIVDIDEKSLAKLGRWPWSRDVLASMIDSLFDHYKIKVIGFDVVFPEKDTSSGLAVLDRLAANELRDIPEFTQSLDKLRPQLENERIFAKSLKGRNIVLGIVFEQNVQNSVGGLPESIASIDSRWLNQLPIFTPTGYTANLPILQENAMTAGFFDNPLVDSDGIFRRVPLLQVYQNNIYQSLALGTARAALGNPDIKIVVVSSGETRNDYNAIEFLQVGDQSIRVDERISALVPYRGRYPSFKYIPAVDVVERTVDKASLKDKIVLFGSTAAGLQDLRATPVQEVYPGVEVHANMVAGILDGTIKHTPAYSKGYELLSLVLIGILLMVLLPRLSPLWTSVFSVGLIGVVLLINMLAWHAGVVLPIVSQLLLITLLFILQMSYGFFIESRNKRALSKVFGQYIPPELVDELDTAGKPVSLEGESREMTVLFSDVRGFTTISEGLDPKALSQLMNEFLTPMTRVIHKHRGTIDKYMGDAIMAFWGAPLNDPYHAKNALLAGMEMIKVLEEQQARFQERGWPEIKIGVGLSTGTMNVGNMGSEFRMAYTVLGDTVNLGSRLEGLTKQYGVSIIVSEAVTEAVPEFEYLELDRVRVKGKDKPVTIYEPLGFSVELDKDIRSEAKRFNKALALYREQNWDMAEREIFSLSQSNPRRAIYKIYLDRIMYFRNNPPGENWDGVFIHTSK